MRPELERLLRIEHQLLGRPQPDPAAGWAVQQLLDAELEADTAAQRRVYQALHAAGRRQLRQELHSIHAQLYGPARNRWARLAAAGRRLFWWGWLWAGGES